MKVASFDTAEWIDAWRDRRPMADDRVQVTFANGAELVVGVGIYNGFWRVEGRLLDRPQVIAWMPLPEAYDPVEADKDFKIVFDGEKGVLRFIKE